mmetsp:Transcript_7320/g.15224  ORF Transcript_7320/g.15224 Transcript_7320/m.15224 type:complete len:228 (-) Transcript_7320:307-990(-)
MPTGEWGASLPLSPSAPQVPFLSSGTEASESPLPLPLPFPLPAILAIPPIPRERTGAVPHSVSRDSPGKNCTRRVMSVTVTVRRTRQSAPAPSFSFSASPSAPASTSTFSFSSSGLAPIAPFAAALSPSNGSPASSTSLAPASGTKRTVREPRNSFCLINRSFSFRRAIIISTTRAPADMLKITKPPSAAMRDELFSYHAVGSIVGANVTVGASVGAPVGGKTTVVV